VVVDCEEGGGEERMVRWVRVLNPGAEVAAVDSRSSGA
jgi:hypothetical protein